MSWELFTDGSVLPTFHGGPACGYAARLIGPGDTEQVLIGINRNLTTTETEAAAILMGLMMAEDAGVIGSELTLFTDNSSLPNIVRGGEKEPRGEIMREALRVIRERGVRVEWLSRASSQMAMVDHLANAAASSLRSRPGAHGEHSFNTMGDLLRWLTQFPTRKDPG